MIQSIKKGREEDGNRAIANKIVQRLHDLEQTIEINQGRWAWELLQNAKDSVSESLDKKISVKIVFDKDHVKFIHNGNCFNERDIRGLINQISSKETEENESTRKVGKFGTGFLTTHLLSRIVNVKGVLNTEEGKYYKFECEINRSGKTSSQLVPNIRKTWEDFDASLKEFNLDDEKQIFTSFHYRLENEQQKNVAQIGISEFSRMLPFVLVFNPEIGTVTIEDHTRAEKTTFRVEASETDFIKVISKFTNGSRETIRILSISNSAVSIAAELELQGSAYCIKRNTEIPKLFCDFPLIGTENFHFPVIVNSFFFNPLTERGGIWLKSDNDEVRENKELLDNAIDLYKELMSKVEDNSFSSLYNLIDTRLPSVSGDHFDETWYKSDVQKRLRKIISNSNIVETEDSEKVLFSSTYFPDSSLDRESREKIWELSSALKVNTLPAKRHIHEWTNLLWRGHNSILNVDDLITDLKNKENLRELSDVLGLNELETINWLNTCLNFILDCESLNKLKLNNLVPDQTGKFRRLIDLSVDSIDDEELKEIADLLGDTYYDKLIHQGILLKEDYGKKITIQDIANNITNLVSSNNYDNQKGRLAIRKLTQRFRLKPEESKTLFATLYTQKEKLFVDTIDDEEKESLDQILTGEMPLSELAKISKGGSDFHELAKLLEDFNASSVTDLREKIELSRSSLDKNNQVEITQEVLLSLGITSFEELEEALKSEDFHSKFIHTSTPTKEMFLYASEKINRAKKNVIKFLNGLPQYDCSNPDELAPTIIGITKNERPVNIVIRPSDNGEVIIHYSAEKDALDYPDDEIGVELWIDNGIDVPQLLTLGAILKKTGINRIPV